MRFDTLFKQLRKELGFSQTEMARKLGTSQGWLSRIEAAKGNPDLSTFLAAMRISYRASQPGAPSPSWELFVQLFVKGGASIS